MKEALRRFLVSTLKAIVSCTGRRGKAILADVLATGINEDVTERIETVSTPRGTINFYCLGELPLWRARTLTTKEPETIEWIDEFDPGETFWDIGANVGIYSIYAAINRKHRVLAFEPSAANYFLLNRNVEHNGLDDFVQAYCMAFTDGDGIDVLNMQSTGFGGALSSFGVAVDHDGHNFTPKFHQGMLGFSIDRFVEMFNPPFPNHIKIDVDGIEDRIVAGAGATLADERLKSISIELDADREAYTAPIIKAIETTGLKLVARRQSPMFAESQYKNIFNYQFRRVRRV